MASTTRQVLAYFEETREAISLGTLAQKLQISSGVLEGILDYWVRKGKLREVVVDGNMCNTCSIQKGCPFVTTLPRYYERVNENDDYNKARNTVNSPTCSTGGCGCSR